MAQRHLINTNITKLPLLGRLKIGTKAMLQGNDRAGRFIETREGFYESSDLVSPISGRIPPSI
jgi:hypothetical protein